MLPNPDQPPQNLSRRDFLKKALQIGGALLVAPTLGTSQHEPTPDQISETLLPKEKIFTHKIISENWNYQLSFKPFDIKPKLPYISEDGKYFDLAKKAYVTKDQCTPEMLLLGDRPGYVDKSEKGKRDTAITPEFVDNKVTAEIAIAIKENINLWIKAKSKDNSESSNSSDIIDLINNPIPNLEIPNNEESQNQEINFTPNKLLILRQVAKAIADTLNYDRDAPYAMKNHSLAERLLAGATNCQEFSLTTSMILAGEPLQIPSEILRFSFKIPPEQIEKIIKQKEKDKGSKLSDEELELLQNPNRAHVCNVINFNGTPVVIDTTSFGTGPVTLSEYFAHYIKNGIQITSDVQFTSILAENSYQAFPWHDSEWINAKTPLDINAAAEPAT